jgi:hypothetical protein
MSAEREFRTTKDGLVRTNRTIDALQPLYAAVRELEQAVGRYVARVEKRRAEERRQQLAELIDRALEKHERLSLLGPCIYSTRRKDPIL